MAGLWGGVLLGGVLKTVWLDPPKWASAAIFVGFGSMALLVAPQVAAAIGVPATALMILGSVFYVAGAVVYGIQRPDPIPAVFGYHEVSHAFVIAGAAAHFAAIALYIIPDAPRA
jgi:hemolysin III